MTTTTDDPWTSFDEAQPPTEGEYEVRFPGGDVHTVFLRWVPDEPQDDPSDHPFEQWVWGWGESDDPEALALDGRRPENTFWRRAETTEHPIIFNDWSIRRILAGEKTQTRRIVRPQPPHEEDITSYHADDPIFAFWRYSGMSSKTEHDGYKAEKPYNPGDVLWCREAFRLPISYENVSPSSYVDSDLPLTARFEADGGQPVDNSFGGDSWGRLRPSIHMPKELCRIRLRVEDVGVERVCDISHEDAIAEGIPDPLRFDRMPEAINEVDLTPDGSAQQLAFKALWEQLHGPEEWGFWVWVISFSVIEPDLS